MNIENLKLWIKALRSGDYEQTTGRLYASPAWAESLTAQWDEKVNPGYCCLGVACEVAIKNGLDLPIKVADDAYERRYYGEDEESAFLPGEVSEWLEIDQENIWVSAPHLDPEYPGRSYSLTELNDEFKLSFSEIADILEDNFIKVKNES